MNGKRVIFWEERIELNFCRFFLNKNRILFIFGLLVFNSV